MPVLNIKAKARKASQRDELIVEANEMASDLLDEEKSDRVLVVYDKQTANIYYERSPPPLRKTGSKS